MNVCSLSIIILTYESAKAKSLCIRHLLWSIADQNFTDFEVIIVDNGLQKTVELPHETELVSLYADKQGKNIKFTIIVTDSKCSKGAARNLGAQSAKSNCLLFIDDDVIMTNPETFKIITAAFSQCKWGLGAVRLWTRNDLFNRNSEQLLDDIKHGEYSKLLKISGRPAPFVRSYEDVEVETLSFIGHFGFCHKQVFTSVNGFGEFDKIDSCEDDYLQMKLFLRLGAPYLLQDVTIVHVNHPISIRRAQEFAYYFSQIILLGIYCFDSSKLLAGDKSNITIPLGLVHYDETIEVAYDRYKDLLPLNDLSVEETKQWRQNFQLGKDSFVRVLYKLVNAVSVDKFIGSNTVDFDSIAPLIQCAVEMNMISIQGDGGIEGNFSFEYYYFDEDRSECCLELVPKSELNQFPCDRTSRIKRAEFIKSRYPYCDFVRFGIIGDDDLLSTEFINEYWFYPVILDIDERVLNIAKKSSGRFSCHKIDLSDPSSDESEMVFEMVPPIHSFIVDPPYTFTGVVSFIYAGLRSMKAETIVDREFYVVLNPMIFGEKIFLRLLKFLSKAGILLCDVIAAFNTYTLPSGYKEFSRAELFAEKNGFIAPINSSTSNLYIFKACHPDLLMLEAAIQKEALYNHYAT